ncbi:MAG: 50S ribosomal protein L17 [Syntrophaceae bacterium]|nr:50S ribosomal protein L17 [Syntrophaceae bacterium]
MRHRKLTTKLGRTASHRKAMFRNMVTSFLKYEKIETTDIKAKELRRVAEKMITLGKRGDLHARRQALAYVRDRDVVEKLFEQISSRFKERKGGYTRIVKTGYRTGDNAPMALIELVGGEKEKAQKAKKPQKTKQKTA